MTQITIRKFEHNDTEATARIFYQAVHLGTAQYYDERQRKAWAPKVPDLDQWHEKLNSQWVYIAEFNQTQIGFMSLKDDGCIDLAFVCPEYMGQGIAQMLYQEIIKKAHEENMAKLYADASYLAQSFFKRNGWVVVQKQSIVRCETVLTNFRMEKLLQPNRDNLPQHRIEKEAIH